MTLGIGHVLTESHDEATCEACQHPWGPPKTLAHVVREAEQYRAEMQRELTELREQVDAGEATWYTYDERAADLRELAEDHLNAILDAYRHEHPPAPYVPCDDPNAPF